MKNKLKLVLPIIGLLLVGCGETNTEETRTYNDYLDHYISIENFYHDNEKYAVYVFGAYCNPCNSIKTKVFDYADSFYKGEKHSFENFYFFEFQRSDSEVGKEQRTNFKDKGENYTGTDEEITKLINEMLNAKPTKVSDTYFISTPSIYVIENGMLTDYIKGSKTIPNWLSSH